MDHRSQQRKNTSKDRVPVNNSCSGRNTIDHTPNISEEIITMEELRAVIKKLKNSESPGPDGLPIEFFKLMNDECFEMVLDIVNDCWINETMPDEMELAELVTLCKKGNVEDPANYRPIALLNTIYKIYASIIQIRLANGLDDSLWETQFGFRKKRSTRRLQDQAECTGDKLFYGIPRLGKSVR